MDISKLSNISLPNYNYSNISSPELIVSSAQNAANSTSEGYFGLGVMIILFIFLLIITFRDDGDIRLDMIRSLLISSGFTTLFGVIGLLTNFFTSFQHVMWFGILFIISLISVYYLKQKGF